MRGESLKSLGKVGLYILLPLMFILIPTSWLEPRRSLCLIRNVFGVKCPGCGMTRAVSCVLHGEFKEALQYNKLVIIVLPLLVSTWVQAMTIEWLRYLAATRR